MAANTKHRLVYCYWGKGLALGIYGTKAEVEQTSNGLYNFEATDSDPIWKNEDEEHAFAYVLTDWDKLKKGLTSMYVVAAQFNKDQKRRKLKDGDIERLAEIKAQKRIDSMEAENFLEKGPIAEVYMVGSKTIEAINS